MYQINIERETIKVKAVYESSGTVGERAWQIMTENRFLSCPLQQSWCVTSSSGKKHNFLCFSWCVSTNVYVPYTSDLPCLKLAATMAVDCKMLLNKQPKMTKMRKAPRKKTDKTMGKKKPLILEVD